MEQMELGGELVKMGGGRGAWGKDAREDVGDEAEHGDWSREGCVGGLFAVFRLKSSWI